MAASYQQSSSCSTSAVQISLTLNKKYLSFFLGGGGEGESTINRKMMTERAKGLGRFQKGERVGEQSWWFVILAAKIHPPTQKCLLTQASQSGSVTWGLHWLYPHPGTWQKNWHFCIPCCWSWLLGDWMPNSRLVAWLPCWPAGHLREEKRKISWSHWLALSASVIFFFVQWLSSEKKKQYRWQCLLKLGVCFFFNNNSNTDSV